jgi:hypothetical protein
LGTVGSPRATPAWLSTHFPHRGCSTRCSPASPPQRAEQLTVVIRRGCERKRQAKPGSPGDARDRTNGNSQNTQIFATSQFTALAAGLKAARASGGPVVYADRYPILPSNPFQLAAYTPLIFWLYNDWNEAWHDQLQPSVKQLFTRWNPFDYLGNFPNYATVGQNDGELLYLMPRQINLLAHMWCYTMLQGFRTVGQAFGVELPASWARFNKYRVFDPWFGPGGVFVPSEKFIEAHGGWAELERREEISHMTEDAAAPRKRLPNRVQAQTTNIP